MRYCPHRGRTWSDKCECLLAKKFVGYFTCYECPPETYNQPANYEKSDKHKTKNKRTVHLDQIFTPVCLHRGEIVDRGPACCGSTGSPIHACNMHGKCASTDLIWNRLRSKEVRVKRCTRCKDRPISVALVSPCWCVGGMERWWLTLAKYAPDDIHFSGVYIHEKSRVDYVMEQELRQYMPLHRTFRKVNADVVMTWTDDKFISLNPNYKQIHVIHNAMDWGKKCALANSPDKYICVSKLTQQKVSEIDSTVIYNSFDPDRLVNNSDKSAIKRKWGINEDELVVGYVGRLSEEKCPLVVAEAAKQLNCKAIFCSVKNEWCEKIEQIRPDVIWANPDTPSDVYNGADVLVMPSEIEASGIVYMEAWYSKIPVVSHLTGAVLDAELDHGFKLTEKIKDHASLADACKAAMQNESMVNIAYNIVVNHYSPYVQSEKYAQIIRGLV